MKAFLNFSISKPSSPTMNERRKQKFEEVAQKSQLSLTVVLENVHDPLNIGAILRTCDSVGIRKIFVINDTCDKKYKRLTLGKRSSMGTRKWVDVLYFHDLDICIQEVRKDFALILGAAIGTSSKSYLETDYTGSVALMMGNEKEGLSHEALNHCDALIKIPQVGMAESLNVSTATAIILYEAFRQRFKAGKYDVNPDLSLKESTRLLEYLYSKDDDRTHNSKKYRLDSLDGIES